MEKQRLLHTLQQLRDELAQTERVDPEKIAELERLTDELRQSLPQQPAKSTDAAKPTASGLRNLLLKYEADHPQLSAAIGRVADALAAMGF